MKVDGNGINSLLQALSPEAATEAARAKLQVGLLKKTLDAQTEAQTELLKMIEGKGQVIDISA